ncbi:unnamed protein product [Chondrus crispus]|uniref:Uncharacterized protein n=1 Tax=Chondrus crispus TaxID=2769 RepID=R7QUS4_CHOCR|nr:unnamed protein product [Chondrus crispus]CDF41413.1 unnamed protein product [Chondrus crispus]|eukprot:XP_005711707.1 unnamed protein product [Chondrus crispus]
MEGDQSEPEQPLRVGVTSFSHPLDLHRDQPYVTVRPNGKKRITELMSRCPTRPGLRATDAQKRDFQRGKYAG